MNFDDALAAMHGEDRPIGWLQYEDGTWAAVFDDGMVSEPFRAGAVRVIGGVVDAAPLGGIDLEP